MARWTRVLSTGLVAPVIFLMLVAPQAHASTTVAQWNMDELSGTTMTDSSGSGNDGTTHGVTMGLSGFTGGGGDFAYGFDGSTSHVNVNSSASLNPGSSDISITVHVQTSVMPGIGDFDFDLVRKASGYKVELYPKNGLGVANCVFKGTVSKVTLKTGPNLIDGQWHTITCSKTSSGISLTVDGQTFTKSGTAGTITNGQPVVLGYQTGGTDFYNGVLDDVSIVIG